MKQLVTEESNFQPRAYTKAELATLYNPTSCITVALKTLSRWMKENELLMAELEAVRYNKYRRTFTPKEVGIIVKYLGEP
ncbi:DUF4248 domain-containing protein [Bacteroides sp. 224]|uniref:DUF4248 domain-containing protein n=1 Tax=Bacteroides sp. 224 TaxID=2302936 RepID=UPI0013D3C6E1|nr:DUF4248 domain-containing protein [Bacteroides sp. 224]NDV64977.1 DUF4248 domain-containing protein [Bacteroides sp. 224]